MQKATAMLLRLAEKRVSLPIDLRRLADALPSILQAAVGHNRVTDANLLGVTVENKMILVTFDRAIVHLAGEYGSHVLLLAEK